MDGSSGELVALLATSCLLYFLSLRAHHFGLVAIPSNRKLHEAEIPTVGGLAIFGGFLLALFTSPVSHVYFVGFVLPALLLVGVGALDDAISMSYKPRFIVQILAGLLMTVAGGVVVDQLGAIVLPGEVITLGVFAIPFTLVCMLGMVNAFNMSDGIDGLAGVLALVALLGLGTVAYIGGRFPMVEGLSLLGFSLVAFLAFNARLPWRKRAVIFLGDSGSTLLGFAVVWFSVSLSQGEQAVMTPITALWLFALPLLDLTTQIIRRSANKRSPFAADREHLHDIFLTAGFSVVQTGLILTAVASVLAMAGLAGLYLGVPENVMLALFLGVFAAYYYLVTQAWKRMRFLGRAMCRRSGQERRSGKDRRCDPGIADQKSYQGADRRSGEDPRVTAGRRRSADQAGNRSVDGIGRPPLEARDSNPKTVFVNRYFWPDHSATSQLLTDLAFTLALHGRRVSVITSRQRYDEPGAKLVSTEKAEGVTIDRVWTSAYGRHGLLGRAFDYLTFYLSALWRMWRTLSRGDILVAMTDPPLICIPAAIVASMRGAKLVIWHQDLFPEVASVLGVIGMRGQLAQMLVRLRNALVRRASLNVVLSRNMAQRLIEEEGSAENIRIIPNWSDGSAICPTAPDENPLRAQWGLKRRFVVGYSGNMGRVHEFGTLLEAAERLRDDPRVVFLFIGDGFHRSRIERRAQQKGLSNIMFQPYQPRERLAHSLCVPDVHVISLRQDMDGLVVPSKLYGVLAAGRPPLFIGAEQGDVAHILRTQGCGLVVREGDVQGVVEGILQLQRDPDLRHAMGDRARALFEQHYDMEFALVSWCHAFTPLYPGAESCEDYEKQHEWAEARHEA